jgi:glycosyltransferase involved in cell wall biosynthesis
VGPTLDSVLAQSYPRLETVVVDDGSTDDTRERCARYGDRVRLITRPNGGSAAARNTGLAAARGVYIAHMDGDDLWHPDKIAVQADAALRYPEAGMLVADGHVLCEGEPDERRLIWGEVGRQLTAAPEPAVSVNCYETMLRRHCFATPSQMMVPASVYRVLGGWETRLRVISDAELSLRIASRYPIVFVRWDLVGYRYVASSISGPKELRSLTWGLEEFRMLRLHRRLAAPAHRRIMRQRARQNAVFQAREAYYRGRRGDRGWAVRYLLRLLRESRRPRLVAPFLASLVLPPGLVAAAVRLLGKRPAGRALAHSGA